MREIVNDSALVAFCGLYCGACRAYLNERCPGCKENIKATWCKIRTCCLENKFTSCANCVTFKDVNDCKKFNNIISKVFALIFRSNRKACVEQIRAKGLAEHAAIMASAGSHTIKRS